MTINIKKILHLSVETQSGLRLGEVSGLEINVEQHVVSRYIVKSSYLPRPFSNELLISPQQVISISEEKMVVEDGAVPGMAAATTPA